MAAAGRMVGFILLSGAAVAAFAAVVLVPEYAELLHARQGLSAQAGRTDEMERQIRANERYIQGILSDPVLNKRLAMFQGDLWPGNSSVALCPAEATDTPPLVPRVAPAAPPEPPPAWVLQAAERLQRPRVARGLLLLSLMSLGTATFLFAPPHRYRRAKKAA